MQDQIVREQLLALLRGGNAHQGFERAVADFPLEKINSRPPGLPYAPWRLLEHMRIAQWDILEFIRDPGHESPSWPEGYWPPEGQAADEARWRQTIQALMADSLALQEIVADPDSDLYAPLPHGEEYTILREILVVSDHNAYHLGEFGLLREALGAWPEG
jgi:hypothetical protein